MGDDNFNIWLLFGIIVKINVLVVLLVNLLYF